MRRNSLIRPETSFKLIVDTESKDSKNYIKKMTDSLKSDLKKSRIDVQAVTIPDPDPTRGDELRKIGELLVKIIPGGKKILDVVKVINEFANRKKCTVEWIIEEKPDGTIKKSFVFKGNLSSEGQQELAKEMSESIAV